MSALPELISILEHYGLAARNYQIEPLGYGLINRTWKITGPDSYVLQQLNTQVFKQPEAIAANLAVLDSYLKHASPGYLFVAPIAAASGEFLVQTAKGEVFRLMPYVEGAVTINEVKDARQAFEAARQFARFTHLLKGFDTGLLKYTLPGFHDLALRYSQFEEACLKAAPERIKAARKQIWQVEQHQNILSTYQEIIADNKLPVRVIHHDTKINNVLFNAHHNSLCVIDLDTVMPGYFISDVGDMLRTYLSPVNEEEADVSRITLNAEYFKAITNGYFSLMGPVLTANEKEYFTYSGKYLMYMQAIRFLTDYLNGDTYYHTTYPAQNLVRAVNQLTLLSKFAEAESEFKQYVDSLG